MEINIIKFIVSENSNDIEGTMRKDIENLIENYKIQLKSLSKMLEVDYVWLKDYMDGKNNLYDFYIDTVNFKENNEDIMNNSNISNPLHLCNMISMLSEWILMVNEDERVSKMLSMAKASNKIPNLKDLETDPYNFGNNGGYQFSYFVIDYIAKTYGYNKLIALIKSPAEFEKILGISIDDFQKNWVAQIK